VRMAEVVGVRPEKETTICPPAYERGDDDPQSAAGGTELHRGWWDTSVLAAVLNPDRR
jgi:hypothetical protein